MNRNSIPRPEYPRPDFVRKEWINLNGIWNFEFDDDNCGLEEKWFQGRDFSGKINVPFPFQSEESGIGDTGFHDVFWYHREIVIPDEWRNFSHILLHIGAFDYEGTLWINGKKVSEHRGGYAPWTVDIGQALQEGRCDLVIRGVDTQSKSQPRGKQYWEEESASIFYTRVSGIWQTVWMEPVPDRWIDSIHIIPVLNPPRVQISVQLKGKGAADSVEVEILDENRKIQSGKAMPTGDEATLELEIPSARTWSPADPFLYGLIVKIFEGDNLKDKIQSYAGIREVRCEGRKILLNDQPVRFMGVLDQGYFPGGIYTPKNESTIKRDVELIRRLGFNGVRKHQKIEDPLWYYWCDRLGVLVWEEMPSAWEFTKESRDALLNEWPEIIRRDWNHPCVIAWVPVNESWGVPDVAENREQQEFLKKLVTLTREIEPTRLVVDNSGWCHIDTDIIDLHFYSGDPAEMTDLLDELLRTGKADRTFEPPVWVGDAHDSGQPIVISEYGGIALESDVKRQEKDDASWGYGNAARSSEELTIRFTRLTKAIFDNPDIAGYVYTQLTDVEQEKNGLLTFDRKPKVSIDDIFHV